MLQYGNKKEISTNWKEERTAVFFCSRREDAIYKIYFHFLITLYHFIITFFIIFHTIFSITFSASQTPGLTLPEDLLALLAEEGAKKKKRSKAKGKKVATDTA